MLDKRKVRLEVENLFKNDINYRLCSYCTNFREDNKYGKCILRQQKSLKCNFEPTFAYSNKVLIKMKKRAAKNHIQKQINELLIKNNKDLVEFGLFPEEINEINNSFRKELIND